MELTGNGFFIPAEVMFMEWLQANLGAGALQAVSALSIFGEPLVLVLLLCYLYWCRDKEMGRYAGMNVLMAVVWNPMIKNVFLRRRPYFDHGQIRIHRPVEPDADVYDIVAQGYSFPSGHSTNAAAAYGSIALYERKRSRGGKKYRFLTAAAVVLPLLVGFSRVAVGAHYPTDVLCGWLLGLFVIIAVPYLCRRIRDRALLNMVLLALTLPGLIWCRSADYFTGLGLLLGFLSGSAFEDRYVQFENSRKILPSVIRIVLGLALFFLLNTVLKLPFTEDFLEGGTYAALLVRCARYAVVSFIEFGVYPLLFKRIR